MTATARVARRLAFDRHELAGAFGDIGTSLPLLIALIAGCDLDAASVCVLFGVLQIATGLFYGIPMPVRPLKAMATVMLAERLSAGTLAGGGLVIGASMLLLALTGLLDRLARGVPKEVVRAIQLGLGFTPATLALGKYAGADGAVGYLLAVVSVVLLLALRRQRRVPAPLVVMGLGVAFAALAKLDASTLAGALASGCRAGRRPRSPSSGRARGCSLCRGFRYRSGTRSSPPARPRATCSPRARCPCAGSASATAS